MYLGAGLGDFWFAIALGNLDEQLAGVVPAHALERQRRDTYQSSNEHGGKFRVVVHACECPRYHHQEVQQPTEEQIQSSLSKLSLGLHQMGGADFNPEVMAQQMVAAGNASGAASSFAGICATLPSVKALVPTEDPDVEDGEDAAEDDRAGDGGE